MKRAFKSLLLLTLVFGLVWLAMLTYWDTSNRAISQNDIWIYLVGMPVAALAAFYVTLKLRQHDAAKPAQTVPPSGQSAEAENPGTVRQPGLKVAILGSAIVCAAGNSVAEFADTIKQSDEVLDLDPELCGSNGFPIMSARVRDLEPAAINAWLRSKAPAELPRQEYTRAVALLERAANDCLQALELPRSQENSSKLPLFELHVRCLTSDSWRESERAFAQQRLELVLGALDFKATSLTLQSSVDVTQSWRDIEQFASAAHADPSRSLLLLLATGSALSPAAVERFEAADRLFSATNQNGIVPGEAAVALMLGSSETGVALKIATQAVLATPVFDKKPQSPQAGRVEHSVMTHLLRILLEESAIETADVATLVCDSDHPTPRGAEIACAMTEVTAHLDPVAQRSSMSTSCGYTGAAAPLLALALGALQTHELKKPVLAAMLSPENLRAATLLMPAVDKIAVAAPAADRTSEKQS